MYLINVLPNNHVLNHVRNNNSSIASSVFYVLQLLASGQPTTNAGSSPASGGGSLSPGGSAGVPGALSPGALPSRVPHNAASQDDRWRRTPEQDRPSAPASTTQLDSQPCSTPAVFMALPTPQRTRILIPA